MDPSVDEEAIADELQKDDELKAAVRQAMKEIMAERYVDPDAVKAAVSEALRESGVAKASKDTAKASNDATNTLGCILIIVMFIVGLWLLFGH